MPELYTNGAETTLNGAINSSVTSITVTDGSIYPSTGNFRIKIGSEIMKVTARSSNVLTVERGSESTTAASHASGAQVVNVLSANALTRILQDAASSGTFANRPSTGNLYFHTDGNVFSQYNGTSWITRGPIMELTDPNLTTFGSALNSPTTYTTSAFQHRLIGTTGANRQIVVPMTAPSTPYTITGIFRSYQIYKTVNHGISMGVRDSSTGRIRHIRTWDGDTAATRIFCSRANDLNATNVANEVDLRLVASDLRCIRIFNNGTNVVYSFGMDPTYMIDVTTTTTTNHVATIDQIFWGIEWAGPGTAPNCVDLLSWKVE